MKLYEFSNGDTVHRYEKSIVICFQGPRSVLSTGPNNGGFRTDLSAVFNHDANPGSGMGIRLLADTYREHMDIIAEKQLGLSAETCTGLMTAASMNNAALHTVSYDDFSVTAIVTAGVRSNGGRIGDPASWHEKAENDFHSTPGTINILLYVEASLSAEALAQALMSCTEAKTAALQELLIPSRYSCGLATGTGTDGIIIVADTTSSVHLTNAGKHSKLGECIGKAVIAALKESLYAQQGINGEYQHDLLHRMDRFGITPDALWKTYRSFGAASLSRAEFTDRLDRIKKEDILVTCTSLYAHLLDQLQWGLLREEECLSAGKAILRLAGLSDFEEQLSSSAPSQQEGKQTASGKHQDTFSLMIDLYLRGLLALLSSAR